MDRLQLLKGFYTDEPTDPFNIYGLALEYMKTDTEQSKTYFDLLLTDFPDYLATYYITAKLYEELGLEDEAVAIYKKGITVSEAQNNQKTANELKNALLNLEMEM